MNTREENYQLSSLLLSDDKSSVSGSLASNDLIQIVPKLNDGQLDQDVHAGYIIHQKTLSRGQFGKVHLATHLKTFQLVALKVINKRRFRNACDKNRVFNEIYTLKVLDHSNISRLLQVIENDKCIYIVQEYCSNGDLFSFVERKGRLNESESRLIFSDLINCLDYIHQQDIVHGDIRPENVLLDSSFRIKLIGFQLARHHHHHHHHPTDIGESFLQELAVTKQSQQYISKEYTAPEMLNGSSVVGCNAPSIDVWSAGVLLCFITTGMLPFAKDSLASGQLIAKTQTGIFELLSALSSQLGDLIVSMLKVSPVERASVKQILSHQWLQLQQQQEEDEVKKMAFKPADFEDGLNEAALKECLLLHSPEVQNDIVQMRFNIHFKFGYHTATYWLIKENFEQYKTLGLKLGSTSLRNRLQPMANQKCRIPATEAAGPPAPALAMHQKLTAMESRVAPNSPKVVVKSCKSTLSDGEESAITASLGGGSSQESEPPSESKEHHKVPVQDAHHRRTSIVGGGSGKDTENCLTAKGKMLTTATETTGKSMTLWHPAKAKSHFNLRRIFSKPQIADERSNWSQSIEESSHQFADHRSPSPSPSSSPSSSQQMLSHTSSISSLKQCLTRRFSTFASYATKFFNCKTLWQINSASADSNKSRGGNSTEATGTFAASVATNGKRVFSRRLLRGDQSQICSFTETTDSDESEQRLNRPSKGIRRVHSDTQSIDQTDGQIQAHQHQCIYSSSSSISSSDCTDTFSDAFCSSSLSSSADSALAPSFDTGTVRCPVNRHRKTTTTAATPVRLKSSSLAIITRYSNYEECHRETLRILSRKGINCKAKKEKLRCCVSAMNEIVLVFRADFITMPSMNGGTFVIIKVKKLKGRKEDFHVIADCLKHRFERRHLPRN